MHCAPSGVSLPASRTAEVPQSDTNCTAYEYTRTRCPVAALVSHPAGFVRLAFHAFRPGAGRLCARPCHRRFHGRRRRRCPRGRGADRRLRRGRHLLARHDETRHRLFLSCPLHARRPGGGHLRAAHQEGGLRTLRAPRRGAVQPPQPLRRPRPPRPHAQGARARRGRREGHENQDGLPRRHPNI